MFQIKPKFSNDKKNLNLNVGHLLTNLAEIIFAHKRTLSFSNNFKNTRCTVQREITLVMFGLNNVSNFD
jgi:hypothetical protein